ncbi:DNA repair endonuclease XPF [Eumeta japonica]|uniref:DNA repair endonuclease XPF n=1 Tax=Eumeta variegata TaxID=151549 RepID=A0A4C1W4R5_EUMVA|nr:DNA repair endonuclease XPF [Eumeta japonica]
MISAEDANTCNENRNVDIKKPMLDFEKQIFEDMFDKEALLILAKEQAYLEGGIQIVSTRILVVDLLKNRVPVSHITGIIVLRAHTVLESCQEAFALRLYRQKNKTGFIKAFSNSPISFTFGYHQVEKVMRALFVTELFLWPRSLIHEDAVSFYALVSKYRTPEYAQVNSGWILLDSAEELFKLARGRVFNNKKEFDPEVCPKWKCLCDLLINEIPDDVKKKRKEELNNIKILILCQDNKTCSQLNQLLTMGANKYLLYTALRRDLAVTTIAKKYKKLKSSLPQEVKCSKKVDKKDYDETTKEFDHCDEDYLVEEENKSNYILTLSQCPAQTENDSDEDQTMFEPFSQMEKLDITQVTVEKPIIMIQTFKENGNHFSLEQTLENMRPEFIIMYHSDVSAIRQIEVFEARKKPEEVVSTVYFIIHNKTVEEQAYLTSLKREKQAFELLIETKSIMVVPTYQDGKTDEYFNLNIEEKDDAVDSRKAGGQAQGQTERPLVVVDMREFRSELPALLHKRGIHIEPVTISIGDYILTPDICVERKSVSDLIGSLNSGRLFTQCTHMCRNYARPVLLVEFDQNKPFNLQGHLVVSHDLSAAEVRQRLQLLTIHFPRLKIVWSPSPYATADLFHELKQGRKNPCVNQAMAQSDENSEELGWERYNTLIHDFVMKLPGVTTKNVSRIMNKGKSLDHLVTLTREQMCGITENQNEAETLYSVLHMRAKPSDAADRDDKPSWKRKFTGKIFAHKKDKK